MGPPAGGRRLTLALGRWLFRWRSFTPLPVLAALVWLEFHRSTGSTRLPLAWALGAVTLCGLGQALRAYVRGVVPLSTSGQGLQLAAGSLNTGGAYRFCRNPLYLGNLLIFAGLLALAFGPDRNPLAIAAGLAFFFFEYHFIIRAEENFLENRFGEAYRDYCRRVPRFWPRPTPAVTAGIVEPFDWRRAIRTEHNGAAAWILGTVAIIGLRSLADQSPITARAAAPWLAALVLISLVYLFVKGWKRGWWLSAAARDNP
jgi:protein-S-isoprenylcysteine O-methyltransferase Ste14